MAKTAQQRLDEARSKNNMHSPESVSIEGGDDIGNKGGRTKDYLKINDIVRDPNKLEKVRRYMIIRKGKQYAETPAEQMVDEWVEHMRYFNTNEVSTVKEAMKIHNMSQGEKNVTGEAYQLYDQLGMFWQNDGLAGTVDGLWDYMKAVATSPSTYVGFGIGKGLSWGAQKAGTAAIRKKLIQDAVKNRAQGTTIKSVSRDLAKRHAKKDAWTLALTTGAVDGGVAAYQDKTQQGAELEAGSREEYDPFQTLISASLQGGMSTVLTRLVPEGARKTGRHGQARRLRMARSQRFSVDENNREEAFKGAGEAFAKKFTKDYRQFRKGAEEGSKLRETMPRSWQSRVDSAEIDETTGRISNVKRPVDATGKPTGTMSEADKLIEPHDSGFSFDFMKRLLGAVRSTDFREHGIRFAADVNEAEQLSILVENLPEKELEEFRNIVWAETGLWLGDIGDRVALGKKLGNQVRHTWSNAGSILQLANDANKNFLINEAIVQGKVEEGQNMRTLLLENEDVKRLLFGNTKDKTKDPQRAAYLNSVWKRMLVSTPQTTAVNVQGWASLYAANTAAEFVQSGLLLGLGMVSGAGLTETSRQSLKQSWGLMRLQYEKLRNFADPYATKESYIELLNANAKDKARLYDTTAGGIIASGDRFSMNPDSKVFTATEAVVRTAQNISGVQIQDLWTKSQSYLNAMNKHLLLNRGKTLDEALNDGDLSLFDLDIMGKSGNDTLESVYSADYKQKARIGDPYAGDYLFGKPGELAARAIGKPIDDMHHLVRGVASVVENVSNNSLFGYYLPFGRFMNNVVAFSYKWHPFAGLIPGVAAIAKGQKLEATQAFSRAIVGYTVMNYMVDVDRIKEKAGLAWNELQFGDGSIIDITNVFPFSLAANYARIKNRMDRGQTVGANLWEDLGKQVAIGQVSRDLEFGNDLTKLIQASDIFGNAPEYSKEQGSAVMKSNWDNYWSTKYSPIGQSLADSGIGNIVAGFTRPLDPLNRIIGVATGTDIAVDRRLPKSGVTRFNMQAGRYVDNIFEALSGQIYGEPLQKLTRQEDEIRDPSILSGMAGIKTMLPKTYAERAFAMVDMPAWKTNIYTGVPEHDAFINNVISPILERKARVLLKNKKFRSDKTSMEYKRRQVNNMVKSAKAEVAKFYFKGDPKGEAALNWRKKKLDRTPRNYLLDARRTTGIQTPIRQMNASEVRRLENHIKFIKTEPDAFN